MFKLGHFPIVHFKTLNYYSFPYQKVSTFEAWSPAVVSIVQNGILKWMHKPTMKILMGGPLPGFSPFDGPPAKIHICNRLWAPLMPYLFWIHGYLCFLSHLCFFLCLSKSTSTIQLSTWYINLWLKELLSPPCQNLTAPMEERSRDFSSSGRPWWHYWHCRSTNWGKCS